MISSESLEDVGRWLDTALAGRPAPPLLILIGLGDGVLEALDRRAPQTRVLALEPDPAAAERFLQDPEARRWRESGRLTYLVDPDYAGADEAWKAFPAAPDAHKLIVDPAVARVGGPGALRAARIAKHIIFGAKANADARRRFAPGYLTSTIHNLPEILHGHDLRGLTGFYTGAPAVIAGAGPSLDASLEALGRTRDRAVLIAADTALRPLLNHGLSPQLVVAVDPQALNARHFQALPDCSRTWLVSEASIDPTVIAPFDRRTFWFRVADHHPWPWFQEIGVDAARIDVWGSVVTAAFQIAVLAGCDPIVLAGVDLAFTGGRPYCRGTTYEFDWAHAAASGHSIDRAWHPFLKPDEQIRVPDLHGAETVTSGYLQSFRDWLVARAQKSGRRVINASGAGIFFGDGIEQVPLSDALPDTRALPPLDTLTRVPPSAQSPSAIAARLRDVRRGLSRKPAPSPIDRWKDFTGDGFNADAVAAALDRAERTLEPRTTAPPAATAAGLPWTRLTDSGSARHLLPELPEAMARLRAALGAQDSLPALRSHAPASDGDRAICLVDAFDILRRLCSVACRTTELGSLVAVDPHQLGRAPLGALLTWPPHAGWAVRLFEGLLGAAWSSPVGRPAGASFFSRPVAPHESSSARGGSARPSARSRADQACAALALEWLLCARQNAGSSRDLEHAHLWWRGLADAAASTQPSSTPDTGAVLVLESDEVEPVELPVACGGARLVRVLTGAIDDAPSDACVELARVQTPARSVSMHLRIGAPAPPRPAAPRAATSKPLLVPRVLTDEGAARSVFAYTAADGAVCANLHGRESVRVREDGSIEPHHTWPYPINGELPLGPHGAVAWSVGKATWPRGGAGYLMVRSAPDAEPSIEELPFGPTAGAWVNGRLYWTCYPFGVGTWSPGEPATLAVPDQAIYGIHPFESGLLLHPRVRGAGGETIRRLSREGWRWQPGRPLEAMALGPNGAESSRATQGTWTAIAHPEADVVRLESASGESHSMICYYPFMVAWAGQSLLVCTNDGDVLLFEKLLDALEGRR